MKSIAAMIVLLLMMNSCSDMAEAPTDIGPEERYKSLIALHIDTIPYEVILYGSDGVTILTSSERNLILAGPHRFPTLELRGIDSVWSFHWQNDTTTFLMGYRQPTKNVFSSTNGGVVLYGTVIQRKNDQIDTTLFDTPQFYLPYPANEGVYGDNGKGGVGETVMGNDVPLYLRGTIVKTVQYKMSSTFEETWSWYVAGEGLAVQMQYRNGVRYRSLVRLK